MGVTYTHVVVKRPAQIRLVKWLRESGIDAVVSPPVNEVSLFSEKGAGFQESDRLARAVSERFEAPAVVIYVLDDDVLNYRLYERGKLADDYDSCPDYHDFRGEHDPPRPPSGGNARKLAQAFGSSAEAPLAAALRKELLFEDECDRHREIAGHLGWPSFVCPFDYDRAALHQYEHGSLSWTTKPDVAEDS